MARPKPQVLLTTSVSDNLSLDILAAPKFYAVLYQGEHINIRYRYWRVDGEFTKYHKTAYPNKKAAENTARKLNEQFFTDDFTVKQIL